MLSLIPILLQTVGPILAKLIPDPKAQADAQAEIIQALATQESAINDAMSKVMTADAASESWMTRNARPAVCFAMIFLLFWISMFAPALDAIFGSKILVATLQGLTQVPEQVWSTMMITIGGFMAARSVEKITTGLKK